MFSFDADKGMKNIQIQDEEEQIETNEGLNKLSDKIYEKDFKNTMTKDEFTTKLSDEVKTSKYIKKFRETHEKEKEQGADESEINSKFDKKMRQNGRRLFLESLKKLRSTHQ
jgi:hypothetical protein